MASTSRSRPKTLLIITQVYIPDPAAVGQHIADVAEQMAAAGWRVVVYTSVRGYENPAAKYAYRELMKGVDVRRLPFSSFGKRSIAVRLIAQAMFMLQATVLALFTRRLSLVLVSTSPPFAGTAGVILRAIRGAPFVWWVMDLNPDQLIATGAIRADSLAARVFDWLNRLTLLRAARVITLDRFMAARLRSKRDIEDRLTVIPPWSPALENAPSGKTRQDFRATHSLDKSFVVCYSGNHALQHPLTTVLEAAIHFEHEADVQFLFIGGGAGKTAVDARVRAGARNVKSLPFQPLADVGASLGAADVHVVSMGNDMVGVVHPCKIYGALAIGQPVLFLGPRDSHIGDIMTDYPIGEIVSHGDVDGVVQAIARLRCMPQSAKTEIETNSAALMRDKFNRAQTMADVCRVLEAAAAPRGRE
jgi:colanic acid biosynthesis glycosyl transferase WcaI